MDLDYREAQSPNELGRALVDAAGMGNFAACKALLELGADVEWAQPTVMSPLCAASHKGHVDVVRLLLAAGADVNAADELGMRALSWAMQGPKRFEVAKVLLEAGAEVNFLSWRGRIPLAVACGHADVPLIELLVQYGADPNIAGPRTLTVLQSAVYWDQEVPVRTLARLCAIDMGQVTHAGESLVDLAKNSPLMLILLRALAAERAAIEAIGDAHEAGAVPASKSREAAPI
jgi:ankyrin repeat protein